MAGKSTVDATVHQSLNQSKTQPFFHKYASYLVRSATKRRDTMHVSQPDFRSDTAKLPNANASTEPNLLPMTDRSAPGWMQVFSLVFASASGLCILVIATMAVFLQNLVIDRGTLIVAPLLLAVGLVPVLATLIFDWVHVRSVAGYRSFRERWTVQGRAAVAVMVCLVLSVVHPLMGLGIVISGGLGALFYSTLRYFGQRERYWDFDPAEAISILAGRDGTGFRLAETEPSENALSAWGTQVLPWFGALVAMATNSWLVASEVIAPSTFAAGTLITLWAAQELVQFLRLRYSSISGNEQAQPEVTLLPMEQDATETSGLLVSNLCVQGISEQARVKDLSLCIESGRIALIGGESGAGKTTLLQAIIDPASLEDMRVQGRVMLNGGNLWHRRARATAVPAVLVGHHPLLLPASGAENLACFNDDHALDRGKRILESLLFSALAADQVCSTQNAQHLPQGQKKALALARAFLLSPSLYLLDRPEDGLTEKQIVALSDRLRQESRMGRTIVMTTEHRLLAELADDMIILQEGRIIDHGTAEEIRQGQMAGWARFVGARNIDTLENLERWVRAQFLRNGDEANQRKVTKAAAELLALSCQTASDLTAQTLRFSLKHYEGYCLIRLIDDDPALNNAQLQLAERALADESPNKARLQPLAAAMKESLAIETGLDGDRRFVELRIATHDPRKSSMLEGRPDVAAYL
jgi:ABC-type multidrug transport system ATPase subunit